MTILPKTLSCGPIPPADLPSMKAPRLRSMSASVPPQKFVTVDSYIGLTEEEAKRAIEENGLRVGNVSRKADSTVPEGVVISQSLQVGATANKDSAVDLVISSGKPIVDVNLLLPVPDTTNKFVVTVYYNGQSIYSSGRIDPTSISGEEIAIALKADMFVPQNLSPTITIKLDDYRYKEYQLNFNTGKYHQTGSFELPDSFLKTSSVPKPSSAPAPSEADSSQGKVSSVPSRPSVESDSDVPSEKGRRMKQGILVKAIAGFYYVETGSAVYECKARGLFRKQEQAPLVGDRVVIETAPDGKGVVESILERKNCFGRPPVANLDQLVVVGSVLRTQGTFCRWIA